MAGTLKSGKKGMITEIKGETSSQGPRHLNLTRRQPYGVVAKLNPFNHPFRFCAEKAAAERIMALRPFPRAACVTPSRRRSTVITILPPLHIISTASQATSDQTYRRACALTTVR
jgi:hypothetical protein